MTEKDFTPHFTNVIYCFEFFRKRFLMVAIKANLNDYLEKRKSL